MALPQIYEGTAEEIAQLLLSSNLTGKLKAIITPDEYGISVINGKGEMLDTALAGLLEEADRLERETPVPSKDPQEKAFGEILDEKYRKMGFKL